MTQEYTEKRNEPVVARLARLSCSETSPDEFLSAFFGVVSAAVGAEAGRLWLYNSENRQLVPKIVSPRDSGPLKDVDDAISNIAYRTVENRTPVLYYPETGEPEALTNVCLMSIPVEIDAANSAVLMFARSSADGSGYSRDDVHTISSLGVYIAAYFARHQARTATATAARMGRLAEVESDLAGATEFEKMLYILANRARELMFFDRVFIAVPRGSSFRIGAVSGIDDVQQQGAVIQSLRDLAREVSRIGGDWHFTAEYIEKVEDEALRARLTEYFGTTEFKSILFSRIEDAGGLLALAAFERRAQGAYSPGDFQFMQAFSKITAKALRRAHDFSCLPGIEVVKRASRLKKTAFGPARHRFFLKIAVAAALAGLFFFGRITFNVRGDCELKPYRVAAAAPRADGLVKEVLVREGDYVAKGQVIARLDDRQVQNDIRAAELDLIRSEAMIRLYQGRDVGKWELEQISRDIYRNRLAALQLDLEDIEVRAPQDGIVITPQDELSTAVDTVKQRNEPIARIADLSSVYIEVSVEERDIGLVKPGQRMEMVLKGAPGASIMSEVVQVSPATRQTFGRNVFIARGLVDNSGGLLHPGLSGTVKIPVGKRPVFYVVFRRTIDWLQTKVLWF